MDDLELLRRYASDGCAESFGVIVRRHIDWVYSASLRQVGEAAMAEDVTQSVFVLLARRAKEIDRKVTLRGWLFNTLRFVAREAKRKQGRRRRHEARVALEVGAAAPGVDAIEEGAWAQMSPLLDEAVASLRESDRQAILLRFYEGNSFAELAKTLEISEVAARKRVSRAVERLGAFFKRRGVVVSATLAATLMMARSATAAPLELLSTVSAAGGTASAVGSVALTLARGASGRIAAARRRLAAAILACMGLLGAGFCTTAWLLDAPSDDALPRLDIPPGQRPSITARSVDGLLDSIYSSRPRRRLEGKTNFQITPVSSPPSALLPEPEATGWVTRWLDQWKASQAKRTLTAAARRIGDADAAQIDPKTGRPTTPQDGASPDDVNSFAELGHPIGGGGGHATQNAPASSTTTPDGAAKSSGDHGGGDWRGAMAEVVVASSSSATSSAAQAQAIPSIVASVTHDVTFTHFAPNDPSDYYILQEISGNVRRFILVRSDTQLTITERSEDGWDTAIGAPVVLVATPTPGTAYSITGMIDQLSETDPALAAELARTFPQGVDPSDPAQWVVFEQFVSHIHLPEAVHSNAPEIVAAPEPGGIGIALLAVGAALLRRRKRPPAPAR